MTDARGELTLRSVLPEEVLVVERADPGRIAGEVAVLEGLRGAEHAWRGQRSIGWPVVDCPASGPVAVFPLGIDRSLQQPLRGEVRDGALAVTDIAPDVSALLAFWPDGTRARLGVPPSDARGETVAPYRSRSLTLHLRGPTGLPVAGVLVEAAERGAEAGLHLVACTDDDGVARLSGLHRGVVEVFATAAGPFGKPRRQPLGFMAAGCDDETLDWVFSAGREVELTLVIAGQACLPEAVGVSGTRGFVGPLREDPSSGVVRFAVWADRGQLAVPVAVSAQGYLPEFVLVSFTGSDPVVRRRLVLQRPADVEAVVWPPADGEYELAMQFQPPKDPRWLNVTGAHIERLGTAHEYRVERVPPGCYRLIDRVSGVVGTTIEVRRGQRLPRLELDLQRSAWVPGRVTLPDDVDSEALEVIVATADGLRKPAVQLAANGGFRVRVPGNGQLVVTARHPKCGPATDGADRIELCGTEELIELRLDRVVDVRFSVADAGADSSAVRVRLAPVGERSGSQQDREVRRCAHGGYEFSAATGRYDVHLDVPGRAPLVLRNMDLTGATDLGVLTADRGESVNVRMRLPRDVLPPPVTVTAIGLDGNALRRHAQSRDRTTLSVPGLLPGRYRLELRSARGALVEVRMDQEVVVEPGAPADVEFDLRRRRRR